MKQITTLFSYLLVITCFLFIDCHVSMAESGVYVGGHIRRERPNTITKLKNSGFTYVILFNVNVESDGTLKTDGETICQNGQYVFGNTQPNYQADIKALKTSPTHINRIEICIGGWGNESYDHIKTLINNNGTGSETMLYKNFKALKNAIPELDGVNNDDENCYDLSTATRFHVMMKDLGYKTSLAPYMNKDFWSQLATNINNQRSNAVDRIMVQCYDGGAGNNPSNWHINGITLHAGRMNYQDGGMSGSINQFQSWKNDNGVTGGFVWVYNDETWDLNAWATRMNRVFGSCNSATNPVATVYEGANYEGYSKQLAEGNYTMADLAAYGITNDDISSIKISTGFKITLYDNDKYGGSTASFTSDATFVGSDRNDKCTSSKIEPSGVTDISGIYKIKNRNSGLYLDMAGNGTENGTNVVQYNDEGEEAFQLYEFKHKGNGVYTITCKGNGKVLDIKESKSDNGTVVQAYTSNDTKAQQFILVDKGSGYYQIIARNCGKPIEVPGSSKQAGEWIKIYDNNGTNAQQWQLIKLKPIGVAVASIYNDLNYAGTSLSLPEGSHSLNQLKIYGFADNSLTSLKVTKGYKATIYVDDNFKGSSKSFTSDVNWIGDDWNDKTSSIKIEAQGISGLNGEYKIQNKNSSLYLDLYENKTDNNTAIVQWNDLGKSETQKFKLVERDNGVYSIYSAPANRVFDVANASVNDRANIQLYDYYADAHNQQFMICDAGNGYYQFIARHCGKVIEVPESDKNAGEWIKTWSNNGSAAQAWKLVPWSQVITTQINSTSNTENISIYPNPACNYINIKWANYAKRTIYLKDLEGRILCNTNCESNILSIPITEIQNGIYLLIIDNQSYKILVKH